LLILKIIGIIILAVIGLVVVLLLTVLLVPIRYRLKAAHGENYLEAEGTVSWLFHFIHARIIFRDSKPHIRVRIFGKIIFDNLRPKSVKSKKVKKTKTKHKAARRKKQVAKKPPVDHAPGVPREDTGKEAGPKDRAIDKEQLTEFESLDEKISEQTRLTEQERLEEKIAEQTRLTEQERLEEKISEQTRMTEQVRMDEKESEQTRLTGQKNKKPTLFERLKNKFKQIKNSIITFFQGIQGKIKKGIEAFANIKQKISLIKAFIKDEINKEVFKLTFKSLIKILKHIMPRKLKSSIVFGTGDPCSTGQTLGVLAFLYSFYGDKIQITPDFENKIFEGRHYAKGRIRLVTILIIVIKLILDKRFTQFRNNMKTLKEAL
jgi:hypothetical protein